MSKSKGGNRGSGSGKSNDRYVVRHPDGWGVKGPNAERASSVHDTQADAQRQAKKVVENPGGGEVRTHGQDGKWRESDTVKPGNDPYPPKDKKH